MDVNLIADLEVVGGLGAVVLDVHHDVGLLCVIHIPLVRTTTK